ncbi:MULTISPECIES: double-strand break repair helicase AddA [unclassified Sphingopyxis]|jgi:ATP-dependent helicase/nuclease subunit A|uniref:double-strand break repair helicase AddA n=1 Tax=unclassified Sphingopyxis TaxID=2614943 RepID=UPI0006BFEA6E|nr:MULTISPECIES: double-strand break repair helicase AddA [unclassified Sphingopyxis]USI76314.1 double-strand break repair helicase AddA [Sphingopyxis sp. USTB-05]GAO76969.1 ATP-dependent nuclease subunit A [Sphingopyxis sp. C-1]
MTRLHDLDPGQQAAAEPGEHVWLGASAGTGKTQVLSARVLRLMLAGVAPDAILCITFTKAGAAEMAHRIHERLALWVRMGDADLRVDLNALGADWQQPGVLDRARSLFATVIDSAPGAIRVQTIHSFCQTLLASFPLEAKIMPGFRALEEGEAAELQRQVMGKLLAEAGADGDAMRGQAAMLSRRMGQDAAMAFLVRCAHAFAAPFQTRVLPPRAHDLRAALRLPDGDPDAWLAGRIADGAISDAHIGMVAASGANWGTKTGLGCADAMARWLAADAPARAATLRDLLGCFLTGKGELRADFAGDKGRMTDCLDSAVRVVEAAQSLLASATAMRVADELAAAWDLGSRFAEAYALAKREGGLADFDDLIAIAGSLLRLGQFGEWVRFKLDQRTDHILVDEAQDTNTRQWAIVAALADEFFAGEGAKDGRVRTMFTVGDRKQAIFGFQGTEPAAFEAARIRFGEWAADGGQPFAEVDLVTNYRSSPAVLDVVDEWVAGGGTGLMGLASDEPPHLPFRSAHPGRVELWQPLPVGKAIAAEGESEEGADEDMPEEGGGDPLAPANDPASLRLSRALADEVQGWIEHGKDGRSVAPGDILILVRRRRDLAARIVARLQSLGVPVAGVDRFALTQPLGVQDLLSAMRFAIQPLDDLNLAALLVSPLIGWSQDDLFGFAHGRGKRALWEQLRAREAEVPASTMTALRGLLGMADFTTPYRFLDHVLSGPMQGRRRLYARLGREARDPIDELLNQALAFERLHIPSLLAFLSDVEASRVDIKRQTEARSDVVRVMTVHGSKGLQAPIVILADATDDPEQRQRGFDLSFEGWDRLPVFGMGRDERYGAIAAAHDAKARAEIEEHWRLLYVAMTRAEELLIVTGVTKKEDRSLPELCWHAAVDRVMEGMGCDWQDAGPRWGQKRVHAVNEKAWARRRDKPVAGTPGVVIPDWATKPAPEEARPPRPLAPSALGEDDVASPPQGGERSVAVERGLLLHALFERLPPVAPARRRIAAEHWLKMQAAALDDSARGAMVDEVLGVLDDPAHAGLFGPDSLAEVPLSAVVDGVVVAGIVDRLLVADGTVTVVDYKTGRHVPASAADVQPAYLRQMAAYRDALAAIFPGRRVEAALLYTAAARLIRLDDALLDAHKPGLTATKANLPGSALEPDAPTP